MVRVMDHAVAPAIDQAAAASAAIEPPSEAVSGVDEKICVSCLKPEGGRAYWECGICVGDVCRKCAQFLPEESFPFLNPKPEALSHTYYCQACYDENVAPELEAYQAKLEAAKQTYFFFDRRKKPVPFLKKAREEVVVEGCADRNETILRLAFLTQEQGFNAVLDAVIENEKVRREGWQKTKWSGRPKGLAPAGLRKHFA